jgi:hypothetical protein
VDDLRRKYQQAINTAKTVGLSGFVRERDGRLFIKGTVRTQEHAARIWSAIKNVQTWRNEVVAVIEIRGGSVERSVEHAEAAEDEPA